MRRLSLLALLVFAFPFSGQAAVQARLVPEVTAGGGWASDLFPGAGFGAHGQTSLAPGIGADLSTGPVVKVLSRYRYTLSRYLREGDDAGSDGHDLEVTPRVRLGPGFDLDLPIGVGDLALDETAPVDADLPAGVALRWLEFSPNLRRRIDAASRIEAGGSFRSSALRFDEERARWHGERAWSAFAGGSRRFGARLEAALRYEHTGVSSTLRGYDRSSDALVGALAVAPWRDVVTRATVALDHVRYPGFAVAPDAERRREDLRRVYGLSAFHPVGEHVGLEASVSWTATSSNLAFASGDRLSTWLGVRAELPYWL